MSFIPTLLKYEFAIEKIGHPLDKYQEDHEGANFENSFQMCKGVNVRPPQYFNKDLEIKSLEKEKENNRLQEILNFLFPPRMFSDNGKEWIQYISKNPSIPFDLKGLENELDRMLKIRCARKNGLCLIRRQIYDQLMDELIRQTTVDCIDRGLLLIKVKDNFNMLLYTYRVMLRSSEGFSARRILEASIQSNDRLIKVNNLILQKKNLEKQIYDLKLRVDQIDKRNQEIAKKQELKNVDQNLFLKSLVQQYKIYIDEMMTGSKILN